MRGGEMVADRVTAETSKEELAELMVGRKVLLSLDKQPPEVGEVVLAVDDLAFVDRAGVARVDHVSFTARPGELVGISGVSGNGQNQPMELPAALPPPPAGPSALPGHRF